MMFFGCEDEMVVVGMVVLVVRVQDLLHLYGTVWERSTIRVYNQYIHNAHVLTNCTP